jgi:hypothetical protein
MSTSAFTPVQKPMIVYRNGRKFRLSTDGTYKLYNPYIRPYGYHMLNISANNFNKYLHSGVNKDNFSTMTKNLINNNLVLKPRCTLGVKHSSIKFLGDDSRKTYRIDSSDPLRVDFAPNIARACDSGEAVENYYAEKIDVVKQHHNDMISMCNDMNKPDLAMATQLVRDRQVENLMDQRDRVYVHTGYEVNAPVDPNNSGYSFDSESESEFEPLPESYERKEEVHYNNNNAGSRNIPVETSAANPVVSSNNSVETSGVSQREGSSTSETGASNSTSTNLPNSSEVSRNSNYFPQDSSDVFTTDYNSFDSYEE